MADISIASAITVADIADTRPDEEEEASSLNPLKRKQSDVQEEGYKRQRVSPGKTPSPGRKDDTVTAAAPSAGDQDAPIALNEDVPSRPTRRQNSTTDEKQRGKRLFGALLGNLNQPGDRTTKRRQEIESRRKAEVQRQDDERREDQLRRRENIAQSQQRLQVDIEEKSMRTRHANMLHTANFLRTTSEPRLYYRPWDLRPDEADRIEQQTTEVEARIREELDDFERRYPEREHNGRQPSKDGAESNEYPRAHSPESKDGTREDAPIPAIEEVTQEHANGETAVAAKSEDSKPAEAASPDTSAANRDANDTDIVPLQPPKPAPLEETEEDGDHAAEGDEDTVIY